MKSFACAVALIFFALKGVAFAAEHPPEEGKPEPAGTAAPAEEDGSIAIEFAPPPLEGAISLGIYDAAGKLIRALRETAEEGEFSVGLNGLIARWDGKNDSGETVPADTYTARGVTIGDLVVEGEAYLGNDWVGLDGTPRLHQVSAIAVRPNGLLVLLAINAEGQTELVRAGRDGNVTSHRALPAGDYGARLAATDSADFVAADDRVMRFDLNADEPVAWPVAGVQEIAAGGDRVALATMDMVHLRNAASGDSLAKIPLERPVEALTVSASELAVVQDGKPFLWREQKWHRLDLPALNRALSAALSANGSLWLIDASATTTDLKEFSLDGKFLRHLGVEPGAPLPRQVASADKRRLLYLREENPGEQRIRGLELVESRAEEGPGATEISTWEVVLSQSIRDVASPATAGTLLDGFRPESPMEVTLRENPLQPGVSSPTASIQLIPRGDETLLALADGLPLRPIAASPGLKWSLLGRRVGSRALTVLQSDGLVIEEFSLHRPSNLMQFDAGDYDWPKKASAPSTEENVPPSAPEDSPTGGE